MSLKFSSFALSVLVHATEDIQRISTDLQSAFAVDAGDLNYENLSGHYGNKITAMRSHLIGERADQSSFSLFKRMDTDDRKKMILDLETSLDEHDSIFVRVDRQSLPFNVRLCEDEPVRIKLKPARRMDHLSMIEAYGELLR